MQGNFHSISRFSLTRNVLKLPICSKAHGEREKILEFSKHRQQFNIEILLALRMAINR